MQRTFKCPKYKKDNGHHRYWFDGNKAAIDAQQKRCDEGKMVCDCGELMASAKSPARAK